MSLDVGWSPEGMGENPFDFVLPDSQKEVTTWRWATVTSSTEDGLRIRLDGDTSPLVARPWDMGGPRAVGDRVWVQHQARRVVIHGPERPPEDFAIPGDLDVGGSLDVGGALTLGGDLTVSGSLTVGGVQITAEPAGKVSAYAGTTAPAGYYLCDGSEQSRTTDAALFAAIGTNFGSGNGSTTFNLPDLRGRVVVGIDSSQSEFNVLGETGGAKMHTLTTNEMPSHTHAGSGGNFAVLAGGTQGLKESPSVPISQVSKTAANGGGQAHNNLQPYIAMNYIIKW